MEDLTGKRLGPYQVLGPLGEGGMAAVYKAFQPGVERTVALKVLPRALARDDQFVARFEREARVLANLQHPHILPVFDYGEEDGYTYIAMPFLKSGALSELLKEGPASLAQTEQVISQVGDALDYAHGQGIVHRDIKPSNILIDERGNCLLTDFGIAKLVQETDSKLTATGGIIGTPSYMSPEQGKGGQIDQRSDIYSLGIILYEMATGRVPFKAETPLAVLVKHLHDPLPPPTRLNPALPEAVEQVILKALAKEPADRYQTAGQMAAAMKAAVQALPADEATLLSRPAEATISSSRPSQPTAGAVPAAQVPVRQGPSRRLIAVGLALLAVIIAGGLFFLWQSGAGEEAATAPTTAITSPAGQTASEEPAGDAAAGIAQTATDAPTPLPTDTATPPPTYTPLPTHTPVPTNTPAPTNTPVPTNTPLPTATPTAANSPTPLPTATPAPETEFPLPDDVQNFIQAARGGEITFQTELSVTELFGFYRTALAGQGLVERELLTVQFEGGFSMVFDGAPDGKAVVVQVTDLGLSMPQDLRSVNIRYELEPGRRLHQ